MLYAAIQPHASPFDFYASGPTADMLGCGMRQDMGRALGLKAAFCLPTGAIYLLPNAAWARRVRAPMVRPAGADTLCRKFPSARGRTTAAGIDQLAYRRLHEFVDAFGPSFGLQ